MTERERSTAMLRAVERRASLSIETTLTPARLQGRRALRHMREEQSKP